MPTTKYVYIYKALSLSSSTLAYDQIDISSNTTILLRSLKCTTFMYRSIATQVGKRH